MAKRLSRQELKRDEIAEAAAEAGSWLEENWQTALKIAGTIAVVAIAAVGWILYSRAQRERVEADLANALASFERLEAAGFRDGDVAAVLAELGDVADRAGASGPGAVATLYRASGLVQTGREAEALPLLESVKNADGTLGVAIRTLLAQVYAAEGRHDDAVSTLQALVDGEEPALPIDQTLVELGEALDKAGRDEEADEVYQRVLDEFPATMAASRARELLAS